MKHLFLLFPLLSALLCCKKDDEKHPLLSNNPLKTELDKQVDRIIKPYAQQASAMGVSIGVFQNNQTYYYGYGNTSKGSHRIPDENTVFEIGSITKTFTAAMLVDLVMAQGLSVDSPINQLLPAYIPSLSKNGQEITVKHLLNHTSGLPRLPDNFMNGVDINQPYKHYDSSKVYNFLKTYALPTTPGTVFEYSNTALGLAGLILERQTGKSFEQNLLEKICTPLGMNHTRLSYAPNTEAPLAKGYDKSGTEVPYWNSWGGFAGAGAVLSTTKDMITYAKSQLAPVNSPLSRVFFTCQQVSYQAPTYKIGLTWFVLKAGNGECYFHNGGTGGFRSYIYFSKSNASAVVLLFNNGADDTAAVANELALQLL